MRSVLAYTTARILIFIATLGVLSLTPMRKDTVILLLTSVLLSGLVSYVLLSRYRDAMSSAVTSGVRHKKRQFKESRSSEDL